MSKESQGAQWVHAICSIVFDIDKGQRLEECFPENALTDQEANDVAFHSFPVIMLDNTIRHCPQLHTPVACLYVTGMCVTSLDAVHTPLERC